MQNKLFRQAAAGALAALLVLAPGVGAQERPRAQTRVQVGDADAWFPGLGASIGASVRDASSAEITAAGLTQPGGAFVTQVAAGGPAAQAGLAAGDIVADFDGERVRSARHLVRLVRESAAGRAVRVAYVRDKTRRTADLTPTDSTAEWMNMPELRRQMERAEREFSRALPRFRTEIDEGLRRLPFGDGRRFGVELMPLSDQLATYFGVKDGLLVASVQDDSPASRAGLRAGDVVLSVNGRAVREVVDFLDEMSRTESTLTLTVMRDKKELTLKGTLPERQTRARRGGRSI